jgi:hypothetical protein
MKILQERSVEHEDNSETYNLGEVMKIENDVSVKDDIVAIIKECLKFSLVAIILLFVVGTPLLYLLTKLTQIDVEIAVILTGVVVAILIVIVDQKKLHVNDKVVECNRRLIRKVLKLA